MPNFTIAVLCCQFRWPGGIDILTRFTEALMACADVRVRVLIPDDDRLLPEHDDSGPFSRSARLNSLRLSRLLDRRVLRRHLPREVYEEAFRDLDVQPEVVFHNTTRAGLTACLRRVEASVVFPVLLPFVLPFPFPWVAYVPDLQHLRFPANFSLFKRCLRAVGYRRLVRTAPVLIVTSMDAERDLLEFYPTCAGRTVVLPFAPVPRRSWFLEGRRDVKAKYGLPRKYFVVCNQFWKHKSHTTAFEALARLSGRREADGVGLVCTGRTDDYRFPGLFLSLRRQLDALGISNRVVFTGHIDKLDQIAMVIQSVGVLQPTLFEGAPGAGVVCEAAAIGTPSIVSDIPVNREIESPYVRFFRAGDADDLADKMLDLLDETPTRPDPDALFAEGEKQKRILGEAILGALRRAAAVA